MKKISAIFFIGILSFFVLGFSLFAQEEDSFWDDEFFQEEPLTRLEQAQKFLEDKNFKEAVPLYEKIMESPLDKSEYEEALFGMASIYDQQGKIKLAIRFYRTYKRKSEDPARTKIATQRIDYYENYVVDQFHIGEWYPKLWFYEKTNELAQKYPKHDWLFRHGAYPVVLVFYKLLLVTLFLLLALLFSKQAKNITKPFKVNWGLSSVFVIYTLFLVIQLYLVFLLKPTPDPNNDTVIAFDVVSILSYMVLTAGVLLFLTFRGISWRSLGFGWQNLGHQLILTLKYLVILGILFGLFAFLRAHGFIEQDKILHSYPLSSLGSALYFFQFVLVVLIAPISEEIFYRGFVYPVVRNRVGILMGILLTSLFFALIHVQSIALLFVLSFFLCFTYEKNRSLIPAILVHAFYNFLVRFGGSFLPGQ